jgi:arylsulfatase A-like enzyme
MDRRTFLKSITAGAAGYWLSAIDVKAAGRRGLKPFRKVEASKMNVLFIDIEDMTAVAVGCYGNPIVKTPNLDQFAREGIRFERCYCQAPMCNPSRSSFLTGLRPDSTRVYTNADPMDQLLPEGTLSLPELLRQRGIYTINIGKLFHHTWTANKQMNAFDRLEFCERPKGYQGVSTGYPKHLKEALKALPEPRFRYSSDPAEEKRLAELRAKRDEIWRRTKKDS